MSMVKAIPLTCTGHSRPVTHLSFSGLILSDQNGNSTPSYLMISSCKDGNPMLRDGVSGDWIGTFLGHKGAIWCSRLSGDGAWAVTASADFSCNVWNASTGQLVASLPHNHIVRSCDFAPGTNKQSEHNIKVVTGGQEKLIRIWSISDKSVITEWSVGESPIRTVLWIDQNTIFSACLDGVIAWWDINGNEDSQPTKIREQGLGTALGQVELISGDIVACCGNSAFVIDAKSGEFIKKWDFDYPVSALGFNKNKSQFMTGSSSDTWVRLHDYNSGELLGTIKGHHGPVHALLYSPDSCLAASGSEDGTIRLWKTVTGSYGLWI